MPLQHENKWDLLQVLVLIFASAFGYIYLSYFAVRDNFLQVILPFLSLFLIYFLLLRKADGNKVYLIAGAGILFRLLLLFSTPNLSDDYLRFLWDGSLTANGIDVYLFKPSEVPAGEMLAYKPEMLQLVKSKDFYSVYPPVMQLVFYFAAVLAPQSLTGGVFILKGFIILSEVVTLILLIKLLKEFKLPAEKSFLYFINPLVIIELTGNIHFEALMLPFLLLCVLFLKKNKVLLAAAAFGIAISVKLLPLMLFPLFIKYLGIKKSIPFLICSLLVLSFTFIPFKTITALENIFSSTRLYFQYFEFNASLYFILRWIGYQFYNYNIIQQLGPILSIIIAIGILSYSLKSKLDSKNIFVHILNIYGIYFFFSTTVNPWYIAPLICFAVFTNYKWIIVWSFTIPLTYIYFSHTPFYTYMLLLEYALVYGVLIYEIIQKKKWLQSERELLYLKQG